MSGGPPSTARPEFHEPPATCIFAVCRTYCSGWRKVTAREAGGAMSEPASVLEELAALDLDALTGRQMLDLVAELSTAVRPLRSLLRCGPGRPAIVTSGRQPLRGGGCGGSEGQRGPVARSQGARRTANEASSRRSAIAIPCRQPATAFHAPAAPSCRSKPPSRKACTPCSCTAASVRVRPETCAAHAAS